MEATTRHTHLTVGSWFTVGKGCSIACSVMSGNDVEFMFGSRTNECEFFIEAEALRELLKIGAAVLEEIADLRAQEEAENQEPGAEPGELLSVAGTARSA